MANQARYPFLETLTESEAVARGANLDDKINFSVFNTIKSLSTQENARVAGLFTLDTFLPEILNLTRGDLTAVVRKLVVDRLIIQIFRLEFETTRRQMKTVPCFLATPPGDRDTTFGLWAAANSYSVAQIEKLLAARPPLDRKHFAECLARDLKSEAMPSRDDLKYLLYDFFSEIHPGKFDIVPPAPMIPTTLGEIRDELTRRQIAAEIPDYGFFPLREADHVPVFEMAGRFLLSKVVPRYKSRGNLRGELERILLEETRYFDEGDKPGTTEFNLARAGAVKKEAQAERQAVQNGMRFPGMLTVELIQRTAPFAREEYESAWRAKNEDALQEFVDALNTGTNWPQVIRFLTEDEIAKIPSVAREKLLSGDFVYHDTWLREAAEVHVFIRRDPAAFRLLVEGMQTLPVFQQWQILAMKSVLEKNEFELQALFHDTEFVRSYGRLLRLVYQRYFPWYVRLFLALGINFLRDQAFKNAKQKIQSEQKVLRDRSLRRKAGEAQEKEEERRAAALRVRDTTLANRVIETLDEFYYQKNRIPTIEEVGAEIDMAVGDYNDIIKRGTFQMVKLADGGLLLLYPLDHIWRSRVARLRRALDKIREQAGDDPGDLLAERVRKLEKHLTATESRQPDPGGDDPYDKFSRAVKDHEKKMSQPLDVDFSDDLEV